MRACMCARVISYKLVTTTMFQLSYNLRKLHLSIYVLLLIYL